MLHIFYIVTFTAYKKMMRQKYLIGLIFQLNHPNLQFGVLLLSVHHIILKQYVSYNAIEFNVTIIFFL